MYKECKEEANGLHNGLWIRKGTLVKTEQNMIFCTMSVMYPNININDIV